MTGATGNIYCGLHEFVDMAFLLHLLRPGDLFIDVGANVGSYTVLSSAVCGAKSIAVEPDSETVKSLERNIEANGIAGNVMLVNAALGAIPGTTRFTVGHDTENRVALASDDNTREVPVRTLDDLLFGKQPTLIKLDVEGYEPEVIAGAAHALREKSLLAVIIETVDHQVRATLKSAGFVAACYDPFARILELCAQGVASNSESGNELFVRDLDVCHARLASAPRRSVIGAAV